MTSGLESGHNSSLRMPEPSHDLSKDLKPFHDGPLMPEPIDIAPPAYSTSGPPPSGYRLALTTTAPFPDTDLAGQPPCHDLNGSPVYFGSALLEKSVHPCKLGAHLHPACTVAYGGSELQHHGRYDLLPFTDAMELVPTSNGHLPPGRRPVEGGYEESGAKLYHAMAEINGIRVPGKTGEHLGGCNVGFGGGEHVARNYEILCWK